jgi:hypothetical protein
LGIPASYPRRLSRIGCDRDAALFAGGGGGSKPFVRLDKVFRAVAFAAFDPIQPGVKREAVISAGNNQDRTVGGLQCLPDLRGHERLAATVYFACRFINKPKLPAK